MNEKESVNQIDEYEELQRESYAISQIYTELKKAKAKWPNWVYDPIHAASTLCEEAGETLQAANNFCYSNGDIERLRIEACQTGAMAIRLLENLDKYERIRTYINQDNHVK